MKQPFPEYMHGKYDLVHARLLVVAMLPGDWEIVLRNLAKLLKPGGFLQWEEGEFLNASWEKSNPTSRTEKSKTLHSVFRSALHERFTHGWNTLPDLMRAAGLESVVSDVARSDRLPETREKLTRSAMTLFLTWAHLMVQRGASEAIFGGSLDKLEAEINDEISSGCYHRFNIHIACGRKALE